VIKRCGGPRRGVVALRAILGKARGHMVRIGRALEILQVATDAGGVRSGEVVVPVDVALRALDRGVGSRQREASTAVIKSRVVPGTRVVTLLTARRKAGLYVVRIGRAVEVLDVAGRAIGRGSHKLPVDMALGAGHADVRSGQRELRERIVVKRCRIPRAAVVAGLAGGGEAGLSVRRIVGLVEIRQVTADAGGRCASELPADMAGIAIQRRVCPGQCESRELQMVELGAHPVVHGVALFAGRRQVQRDVINSSRLCICEILLVAREARRRQSLKLSDGCPGVTRVAIDRSVRTNQREAIQVLIDLLNGYMPAFHGVALLAIGAHLAFVNVGVTVRTLRADIREDGLGVALRATHAFVHAAQRIFGGVVIEFGDRSDRLPAAQGVAVLTRNTQASVGTARVRRRLRLPTCQFPARENRQCDHKMQQKRRSQRFAQPAYKRISTNETVAKNVSKGMRKNSNPMPSKLSHLWIVVKGYTSTCFLGQ
jgi:hypothetical protein